MRRLYELGADVRFPLALNELMEQVVQWADCGVEL